MCSDIKIHFLNILNYREQGLSFALKKKLKSLGVEEFKMVMGFV